MYFSLENQFNVVSVTIIFLVVHRRYLLNHVTMGSYQICLQEKDFFRTVLKIYPLRNYTIYLCSKINLHLLIKVLLI